VPTGLTDAARDGVRSALACAGVPLFLPAPAVSAPPPTPDALAELLAALLRSGDARLSGSTACLLVAAPRGIVVEATRRAAAGNADIAPTLHRLYRLARALEASRRPDLEEFLAEAPPLPALPEEPSTLPDPSELHGEMTLWAAAEQERDAREPDFVGGVVRLFDTWIRLRRDELAASNA
jgi:hypothetical protein